MSRAGTSRAGTSVAIRSIELIGQYSGHSLIGEGEATQHKHIDLILDARKKSPHRVAEGALKLVIYLKSERPGYDIETHSVDASGKIVKKTIPMGLANTDATIHMLDRIEGLKKTSDSHELDHIIREHSLVLIQTSAGTFLLAGLVAARPHKGSHFKAYLPI